MVEFLGTMFLLCFTYTEQKDCEHEATSWPHQDFSTLHCAARVISPVRKTNEQGQRACLL